MPRRKNFAMEAYEAFKSELETIRSQQREKAQAIQRWLQQEKQKVCSISLNTSEVLSKHEQFSKPATNDDDDMRSPAYKKHKPLIMSQKKSISADVINAIDKEIKSMKKKQIQAALRARGIDDNGLKAELCLRLLEARTKDLEEEQQKTIQKKSIGEDPDPSPEIARVPINPIAVKSQPEPSQNRGISPFISPSKRAIPSSIPAQVSVPKSSPKPTETQRSVGKLDAKRNNFENNKRVRSPIKTVFSALKNSTVAQKVSHEDKKNDPSPPQSSQSLTKHTANSTTKPLSQVSESYSAGSMARTGTSSLKSLSAKAKNDARVARVQEIRQKSKPLSGHKPLATPQQYVATLSSLSQSSSTKTESSRLLSKMRAKTHTTILQKQQALTASVQRPLMVQHPSNTRAPLAKTQLTSPERPLAGSTPNSNKKTNPSPAKSVQMMSPLSTYAISDKDDDSDDDSMMSDESKIKKKIPRWAQRENLNPTLDNQFAVGGPDPDRIFGEVETCDLAAIFGTNDKKMRYRHRTSSGNWLRDRATSAEKQKYRREMQYATSFQKDRAAVQAAY